MSNGFLLSPSKSDAMWIGTQAQLAAMSKPFADLCISDTPIVPSQSIKIVGVTLDQQLKFSQHVTDVCRAANYHLRALSHIRRFLDIMSAKLLATSIVEAKVDYCNSLFTGLNDHDLQRLQRVQNRAARIVTNSRGTVSSGPLLRELHWLPVPNRIDYKIARLTFKALTNCQPPYLNSLLIPYQPTRSLRSSSSHLLTVPHVTTAFQSRAFSSFAPRL